MDTRDLAEEVVATLRKQRRTLACAESLTGGDVCARLVDVPGVSSVLRGGVVAYSTSLKHRILGVSEPLLKAGGPVQAEVAEQMALGVARLCGADVGVSTTGVAGPGDTEDGPEGTVFIAVASMRSAGEPRVKAVGLHLTGGRDRVREDTVRRAYEMLLDTLSSRS